MVTKRTKKRRRKIPRNFTIKVGAKKFPRPLTKKQATQGAKELRKASKFFGDKSKITVVKIKRNKKKK